MKSRVFVFDDDRSICTVIADWLARRGHETRIFSDADDFCRFFESCPCKDKQVCADILLCDVKLPGISGIELAGDLKKKGCRIRNIGLMSGWWNEESVKEARAIGAEVFKKPSDMGGILEWLSKCTGSTTNERVLSESFVAKKP